MRVSTAFYYQTTQAALMNQQAESDRTQLQISSQKRILTPSDDPIGSAQVLQNSQALASSKSYLSNMSVARYSLSFENSVLGAAGDLISQARDIATTARGLMPLPTERAEIANHLESLMQSLVGYANEKDSQGNYIFSGSKGGTAPYTFTTVADATTTPPTNTVTTTYNGDALQRSAQIAQGRQLPVNDPGSAVFGATPNDVFTTINTMIKDLRSTGSLTGAAFSTAMDGALTNLTSALSNIRSVNAQVGVRVKEIDGTELTETGLKTQYLNEISRIESVDMNEAAVKLKIQQTTLQASQQTFVSSSKLSLFNYL